MENSHQWDFFIAHAGPDRATAENLHRLLSQFSRPFVDSINLQPGDQWDRELANAQSRSRITIILVSAQSDAAYYQRDEIAQAIAMARKPETQHRVVPVFLRTSSVSVTPPYGLSLLHGLSIATTEDLPDVANRLRPLLSSSPPAPLPTPTLTGLRTTHHWSPLGGTVAESHFRLAGPHSVKYVRGEAVVAADVSFHVDGVEVVRRRISMFGFSSMNHPFTLDGVDCLISCRTIPGFIFAHVTVADQEVLKI